MEGVLAELDRLTAAEAAARAAERNAAQRAAAAEAQNAAQVAQYAELTANVGEVTKDLANSQVGVS